MQLGNTSPGSIDNVRMNLLRSGLLASLVVALVLSATQSGSVGAGQPYFASAFKGQPASPAAWRPADWDVTVHSRDRETWQALESMQAHHGSDCGAPPGTHVVRGYEEAVFMCRDHVMTALNATGYGMVYLTPNQLLDFSKDAGGTARLRFDVSTQRGSLRDWLDIWVTPYGDNLQLTLDEWIPDGNGVPRNALHIKMDSFVPQQGPAQTIWKGSVIRNFQTTEIPGNTWQGYESFLSPSASKRETYELQISRTRVRFGMPDRNFWWIDSSIEELGWDQAVVQLGHHSYNPRKDCEVERMAPHGLTACGPNTWHWNNVELSPAKPITITRAQSREVGGAAAAPTPRGSAAELTFPRPAPAGAHLRFAGIGNALEVSLDGGATWQAPQLQGQSKAPVDDHFKSYWLPVPSGTSRILVRGQAWWGGEWLVRDATVWSPQGTAEVAGVRIERPGLPGLQGAWDGLWQALDSLRRAVLRLVTKST